MLVYVAMLEKTIFNIKFENFGQSTQQLFVKKKVKIFDCFVSTYTETKVCKSFCYYLCFYLHVNFCGLYLNFEMHCFISSMSVCDGCFIATRKLCAVLLVTPEPDTLRRRLERVREP